MFLFGPIGRKGYVIFYLSSILAGATLSLDTIINVIDGTFAVMAIPTMLATILLSKRVVEASKVYFLKLRK